jgi:RNA recognition motif-containing protein
VLIGRCPAHAYLCAYRTGHSRGIAFVRYNYQDEAQLAVDKLDGELRGEFSLFWVLGIVLLSFVILVRFYFLLQGGCWMGGQSLCSLPSTGPMLKECKIFS